MKRLPLAVGVAGACVAVLIGLGNVGDARAAPPDDGSQGWCVYTLSQPFVVEISGRKMVSATLKTLPCTGQITPNSQTVCVELQGGGDGPSCVNDPGNFAQVYFAPYRPGSTYISTGIGCGAVAPTFVSSCATRGPSVQRCDALTFSITPATKSGEELLARVAIVSAVRVLTATSLRSPDLRAR